MGAAAGALGAAAGAVLKVLSTRVGAMVENGLASVTMGEVALAAPLVVAFVALNTAMMACYVRGMALAGSVAATVVNVATNVIVSTVVGVVVFGEQSASFTSPRWLLGAAMCVGGMALLVMSSPP